MLSICGKHPYRQSKGIYRNCVCGIGSIEFVNQFLLKNARKQSRYLFWMTNFWIALVQGAESLPDKRYTFSPAHVLHLFFFALYREPLSRRYVAARSSMTRAPDQI